MKIDRSLKILFKFYPLTIGMLIATSVSTTDLYATDNVIKSLPSIVIVRSENAAVFDGGNFAVKDKDTGRMFIGKRAKATKFERVGVGVIIDPTGLIVTNAHVVANASRIKVATFDKSVYEAKIVDSSKQEDLAFITISPQKPLSSIRFADSDLIKVKQDVFTVGSSDLLDSDIKDGRIIGIGKKARSKALKIYSFGLIQTNLGLHKGDSGAPLFDSNGRLLGLLFAAVTQKPNKSFAIPSKKILQYYLEILKEMKKLEE